LEKLDENSPIPLYQQLAIILREKITSGEWTINTLIPSESELCQKYKISRGTVRNAILKLCNEGLFYRKSGNGTFVKKLEVTQPAGKFSRFSQAMKDHFFQPHRKIIDLKQINPDVSVCKIMQLNKGDKVYKLIRLRLAGNDPISLDTSYLNHDLFPNLETERLDQAPLYEILKKDYNIKITLLREAFEPILLDQKNARRLNIKKPMLGLLISRTALYEKQIFEYRKSLLRTDKCYYSVELNS